MISEFLVAGLVPRAMEILQLSVLTSITNAFSTMITEIITFLPNLFAALITLLIGYLIVRAAIGALRFGMQKASFERRIAGTDLGQTIERSGQTVSNIVVTTVKWILYLIVIVYAISVLGIAALTATMLGILAWIPNLIAVAIIVFVGAIVASYVGKVIENTLPRYGVTGGRIIGLAVELLIYALVFNFALIQIGFGAGILFIYNTALAWGIAAALALGIGVPLAFGLKDVVSSMFSGATTVAGSLDEGQNIIVHGIGQEGTVQGTVRSVGLFTTVLQRNGGQGGFLIVPNDALSDKIISVEGGQPPTTAEKKAMSGASSLQNKLEENQVGGAPVSRGPSGTPVVGRASDSAGNRVTDIP
jgi:hypothetical protein